MFASYPNRDHQGEVRGINASRLIHPRGFGESSCTSFAICSLSSARIDRSE